MMTRLLKKVGIAILVPILLFFLLAVLLYLPPVQNWAVKHVAAIASEKTGMQISVEHVNLEFPLNLGVEGVRVLRPKAASKPLSSDNQSLLGWDTVADIRKMVVDIQLKPLFKKNVKVDALELENVKLNTTDFISDTRIQGTFGKLSLESRGFDLKKEQLWVNHALLKDADLLVSLSDTAAVDTTESKNKLRILVDNLQVVRSKVSVRMDHHQADAYLADAQVCDGLIDLGKEEYRVGQFDWKEGELKYDDKSMPQLADGLDYNHISLNKVNIGLDALSYVDNSLNVHVRDVSMQERSGLELRSLSGHVNLNSKVLNVDSLRLLTSESSLNGHLTMELDAFEEKNPGKLSATVDATIGKQDIVKLASNLPSAFKRQWPNQPLTVKGVVSGNMQHVRFNGLNVNLPGAFKVRASGYVTHPTDLARMTADVDVDAKAHDVSFLTGLLLKNALGGVRIPRDIGVSGHMHAKGQHYLANLTATEGSGTMKADIDFDAKTMNYAAQVNADRLNPKHFLPMLDAGPFTGALSIEGSGTDILSKKTKLQAKANITRFRLLGYDLGGMKAMAHIRNGRIFANVDSHNKLLDGSLQVNGFTNTKLLQGTISGEIASIDLYKLGVTDRPLWASSCLHVDVGSDLKEYYQVQGMASDITIRDTADVYRPDDVVLDVLMRRDTTHAVIDCGDFHLRADAKGGYKQLLKQADRLMAQVKTDFQGRKIDLPAFRSKLPMANIYMTTGNTNFFVKMLEGMGCSFQDAAINLVLSPSDGVNGQVHINRLSVDSIRLDTLRLFVESDSANIVYRGQIQNNQNNPQYVFNALFDGRLLENGTDLNVRLFDEKNRLGVKLGAEAEVLDSGIVAHLKTDDLILGYKKFTVNKDNYVSMSNNHRVSAKLILQAADGQGVHIYTDDEHKDVLQDITASLHHFDLAHVLSVLPYAPSITGVLNGDFHVIKSEKDLTVSSSLAIKDFTYEQNPMGNLSTEFVYIPKGDGTHYVDGLLYKDEEQVGSIVGSYDPSGDGNLDAILSLEKLPLSLVNGFITDNIIGFQGYADGSLSLKGPLKKPQVNGEINLDSCFLVSEPYGLSLRFDNRPVRIVGSHLTLNDFNLYAYNENPITLNGTLDFSDLERMAINMRMTGRNVQVIKAKETPKSVVFGKAFVNVFGGIGGELSHLRMGGKVEVLSSSDINYVLRDSPLTTDSQLDDLVKFTDFSDTTATVISRPTPSGFNMDLTIDISNGAHVMAYLNADHSNYVDLMGGGTLRMQYNNVDELQLRGRYTLNNGEMKYSLPIIPLKTFTIKDGSYIEFTGAPMNPRLNITATETVKAPVSNEQGIGESKTFECGVVVTKTLNDMGLEFILSAEDQSIQDDLLSMGAEQRSKLAVSLLATGMYMADGNTNSFSMNSALSAFLNSQINNVTGKALRTLDLSLGIDNTTDMDGNSHMDYSFKFAKRFWNNRLKVSVGGIVTTGSQIVEQRQSFFDNLDVEYRLDDTANKYITGFYKNNVYDWLEGYTQQYGVGFTWRRTLRKLGDIFRFKDVDDKMVPPRDSMQNEEPERMKTKEE